MPTLVHSLQLAPSTTGLSVHSKKKTVNREPLTVNRRRMRLGFTLIEVMIVIALIGILSSFAIYGYQSSQKKARDAQRKSDLQQVKKALEAAKNDCRSGSYFPSYGTIYESSSFVQMSVLLVNGSYMDKNVQDPLYNGTSPSYKIEKQSPTTNVCPVVSGASVGQMLLSGTKTYVLVATLEITSDPESQSSFDKCAVATAPVSFGISGNMARPTSGSGYYFVCPD